MANIYVKSGAAGANNGTSWTDAYTALASATVAAAGDIVRVADTHTETLGAATQFNFSSGTPAAPIPIICVNEGTGLPSTGAKIAMGNVAGGHITIGQGSAYFYGVEFETYPALQNQAFQFNAQPAAAPSLFVFENFVFDHQATGSASGLSVGHGTNDEDFVTLVFKNTNYITASVNNNVRFQRQARMLWDGGSWTGTIPTAGLFKLTSTSAPNVMNLDVNNVDLSAAGTNPIFSGNIGGQSVLRNCKLAASYVAASSITWEDTEASLTLYNCSGGDNHYGFEHYNYSGQTVVDTGIYVSDGAEYNAAGSKYSWKVVTTADASFYAPYVSPWIHKYNETVTAITPYLEILRDGSTVAYQDDEVWAEFSYQGTTGFTLGSFVNDRMALLGTPANQAAGAATWTGGTTPWSGKLAPGAAITPAEIGNLSARICVGAPSITVYVDPQIRT